MDMQILFHYKKSKTPLKITYPTLNFFTILLTNLKMHETGMRMGDDKEHCKLSFHGENQSFKGKLLCFHAVLACFEALENHKNPEIR